LGVGAILVTYYSNSFILFIGLYSHVPNNCEISCFPLTYPNAHACYFYVVLAEVTSVALISSVDFLRCKENSSVQNTTKTVLFLPSWMTTGDIIRPTTTVTASHCAHSFSVFQP